MPSASPEGIEYSIVFNPVKFSSKKSECVLISNLLSKYFVQVSSNLI